MSEQVKKHGFLAILEIITVAIMLVHKNGLKMTFQKMHNSLVQLCGSTF